ncbi:MAG: MerR family transcriptional regulator [Ignavibacteriaceae bacterium]|jgi:MerR family transcriptional regulator/heat shock protein HspR
MEIAKASQPVYTISVAANLLGISVHTLRMYEKEGLIIAYKKDSGHRLYSEDDLERLKCIRKAINESKISIAGIKTIYSFIPCWKITGCSENERSNCPAFTAHSKPCWTFEHKTNICSSRVCRECSVYRDFSDCTKIKNLMNQL